MMSLRNGHGPRSKRCVMASSAQRPAVSSCGCGWDEHCLNQNQPWRDEKVLDHLYNCERLSMEKVGEVVGCGETCVYKWMERHGVERRDFSEAGTIRFSDEPVPFSMHSKGYMVWNEGYDGDSHTVYVHRLASVAWFGFDETGSSQIHHQSEIPWLNLDGNDWPELGIVPLSRADHKQEHYQVTDRELLGAIRRQGCESTAAVGREVGLSGTPLQTRLGRLEEYGWIEGEYANQKSGRRVRTLSLTSSGRGFLDD